MPSPHPVVTYSTQARCTLGKNLKLSTSYPGVAYVRVRVTRQWRTLEYATLEQDVLYFQFLPIVHLESRVPAGVTVGLHCALVVVYSRVRPTRVWCTLEYVLPGCVALQSTSYPGVTYSRVRTSLPGQSPWTLESKSCLESVAAPTPAAEFYDSRGLLLSLSQLCKF